MNLMNFTTIAMIPALATFLGFKWRDKEPSGAASIEWYHQWVETEDLQIRQRILDYNEDDCRATMLVKDWLNRNLSIETYGKP